MKPTTRSLLLPVLVLTGFGTSAHAQVTCGDYLWTADYASASIRSVDPLTGVTVSQLGMVDTVFSTIFSFNGLAIDPSSQVMYVCVDYFGSPLTPPARFLSTVDLNNGTTTPVGPFGNTATSIGSWIATLFFDSSGQLWGVTGRYGNDQGDLYAIDKTTGAGVYVMTFSNIGPGTPTGTACAFDNHTGLLYRFAGRIGTAPPNTVKFYSIDVATQTTTAIPLSGFALDEVNSLVNVGGGNFLWADYFSNYGLVNTNGEVRLLGVLDHLGMGMSLGRHEPNTLPFSRMYGHGCPTNAGGRSGWLVGSGCPSPGSSIDIVHLNGEPNALSILGVGTGATSLPVAPAPCDIQIFPLLGSFVMFADPMGDFSTTIAIPGGFAGGFDWTFQVGQIHTNGLVSMSNALLVHFQ